MQDNEGNEAASPAAATAAVSNTESSGGGGGSGSPTVATPPAKFDDQFHQFAKFANAKSDGKIMNLKNADKWMKQAQLFDKKFTTTDTAISFSKFKAKPMDLKVFREYIDDVCDTKKMDKVKFMEKLLTCGPPGTTGATKVDAIGVTNRLTDTTKYTGSHKERFDSAGKGKGVEGRHNIPSRDGYVQGYKNKASFEKKMNE